MERRLSLKKTGNKQGTLFLGCQQFDACLQHDPHQVHLDITQTKWELVWEILLWLAATYGTYATSASVVDSETDFWRLFVHTIVPPIYKILTLPETDWRVLISLT